MDDQDGYLCLYELSLYSGYWEPGHAHAGSPQGGACLWKFDGKDWKLLKDACAAGYGPGRPPKEPGLFRGEIRKTLGVPQKPS